MTAVFFKRDLSRSYSSGYVYELWWKFMFSHIQHEQKQRATGSNKSTNKISRWAARIWNPIGVHCFSTREAVLSATKANDLETIKYYRALHHYVGPIDVNDLLFIACIHERAQIVDYAIQHGARVGDGLLHEVINSGSIQILDMITPYGSVSVEHIVTALQSDREDIALYLAPLIKDRYDFAEHKEFIQSCSVVYDAVITRLAELPSDNEDD